MAFNDGFYWCKNVLKKQLKLALRIYLSIAIVLAPIFLMSSANAASNVGGWSMGNPVAQGASAVYTGTKNVIINGADYIKKGTAKITPPASSVAKVLARGAAGYALSIAVEQLLGSVDWVLDPANNQIKYKDPDSSAPTNCSSNGSDCPSSYYLYYSSATGGSNYFSTLEAAIKYRLNKESSTNSLVSFQIIADGNPVLVTGSYTSSSTSSACNKNPCSFTYAFNRLVNPNYDSSAQEEDRTKTLPLETVAQKVISNAESGDTNAQVATMAAAADIVDEASKDDAKARPIAQQLESTAQTTPADQAAADTAGTGTGTQTKDPANPDVTNLTLEFPIFCNWAPSVCEAAQVVISFPQTLTNWWEIGKSKAEEWALSISEAWTAAKEWATSEPQEEDSNELEFEDLNIDADQVNLSGSSTCPQDSVSFSLMGKSVTLDMPYQPVCDALNFFKPAVLLVGAVASVYIVAGVRTKEEDQT